MDIVNENSEHIDVQAVHGEQQIEETTSWWPPCLERPSISASNNIMKEEEKGGKAWEMA